MEPAESPNPSKDTSQEEPPVWTYPTRFCRICREDVPATVTMYPPGLPMQFQKPIVEYKNEDEYGRLIKPCMCRGSLRYIHELCLTRSRTENTRSGSLWKCHECKHEFNFNKLRLQHYLSSRITITFFTVAFMLFVVFVLGFVADPIINIYMDPYDSIRGRESIWEELEITSDSDSESPVPYWAQHFTKGLISMGLVGFLKTLFLNPFQWINLRIGGSWSTSGTRAATGRDRAVNISWIAVIIGVCSAFVFFYRWMQAVVQRQLTKLGNNIVDTQLPGDDEDLKPPPGWKPSVPTSEDKTKPTVPGEWSNNQSAAEPAVEKSKEEEEPPKVEEPVAPAPSVVLTPDTDLSPTPSRPDENAAASETTKETTPLMSGSWIDVGHASSSEDKESVLGAHRQGWSFSNL